MMSTNFYFRNKEEYAKHDEANKKVLDKIVTIINDIKMIVNDEDEIQDIQWKLENAAYIGYERIHIGKRSMGWIPLFEKQEGLFSTVAELKNFYEQNIEKYNIINEYNEVFDWDGLFDELISWKGERDSRGSDVYKDSEGYSWARYEFS